MAYITIGSMLVAFAALLVPILIRIRSYKMQLVDQFREWTTLKLCTMEVKIDNHVTLTLVSIGQQDVVIDLGVNIPMYAAQMIHQEEDSLEITWHQYASVKIHHCEKKGAHFYEIAWEAHPESPSILEDHVVLAGAHWYGGGSTYKQDYPMERWNTRMTPFITGKPTGSIFSADYIGTIQERFWLSSRGIGLSVDPEVPLFVSVNDCYDSKLKLVSQFRQPFENTKCRKTTLKYTLCQAQDVTSAYKACAGELFPLPEDFPAEDLFMHPTWDVSRDCTCSMTYLDHIRELILRLTLNNYQCSQIKLAGKWCKHVGDWEFDTDQFPGNTAQVMVDELHKRGIKVVVDFHPFLSSSAPSYSLESPSFLRNRFTGWAATTKWNDEKVAIFDVTNPSAQAALGHSMSVMMNHFHLDGFCFTGSEATICCGGTGRTGKFDNPNAMTKEFLNGLRPSCDGEPTGGIEYRRMSSFTVGVGAQAMPMFARLEGIAPRWDKHSGILSIIPRVLSLGLQGYPFVNPGTIGGESGSAPEEELYIRWMQVVTLMPHMELSTPPWQYSSLVEEITHKMCALHEKYGKMMIGLAREATKTGAPIVRPLWWVAPKDATALTTSSQYLVGEDLMVAPVLEMGARSRDIYFPKGVWKEEMHNNVISGPMWYRDFPADIDELPLFTKVSSD